MKVDFFTYNEEIAMKMGKLLRREVKIDDGESDSPPRYALYDIDLPEMYMEEVDKHVNDNELVDIRIGGGYEIRNSKTGDFIRTKKSLTEIIASQSMDN